MSFYCISFIRMYEDDKTKHKFFVYSITKSGAVERFCAVTGYKKSCIISVDIVT